MTQNFTRKRGAALALSAPLLVFAALFVAYPLVAGVATAFQNNTLLDPEVTFAGLKNFTSLFTAPGFVDSAWFTVRYAAVVVVIELVLGFFLALLANRAFPGKKLFFTLILLPIMIAPALIGIMFRLLLNGDIGAVPALLAQFGVHVSLFAPESVVPLLVVLDVLQWTPFTFLIIYSGLQSFPTDLIEAAQMDGAGYWRRLGSIVLPVLAPVIAAAAFLRSIDALRTFDVIYVLTAGGPGTSTTTISIFIYKTAFEGGDFGKAAAASVILLLVLIPFVPFIVRGIAGERPRRQRRTRTKGASS